MRNKISFFSSLFFFCSLAIVPQLVFAQKITTTYEGVGGDRDSRRRGPVLSVSHEVKTGGSTQILADAHLPNPDYRKYPLRFEFYVNRQLVATQIRTPELPGPVGLDVSPTMATPPFNYAVIATLLHPNKSFPTMIQGAVFDSNLGNHLDCTVLYGSTNSDQAMFVANGVSVNQFGNNAINLTFSAVRSDNDDSINATTNLTLTSGTANGDVRITRNDLTTSHSMNGTYQTLDSGEVSGLSLATVDGELSLSCS